MIDEFHSDVVRWGVFWKKKDREPIGGDLFRMYPGPFDWTLYHIYDSIDSANTVIHEALKDYQCSLTRIAIPRPKDLI